MKMLKLAIIDQRWDVVAHTLVIGLVKAKQKQDKGKENNCVPNDGGKREFRFE